MGGFLTDFLTKSVVGFAVVANLLTSYPEMVSKLPMASAVSFLLSSER